MNEFEDEPTKEIPRETLAEFAATLRVEYPAPGPAQMPPPIVSRARTARLDGVPTFIPVLSRTTSDDFTLRMHSIDHRCARQDGPPDMPDFGEETTDVDVMILDEYLLESA